MFRVILFSTIVIAFYLLSIWQYRNPTKAIQLWFKSAFLEEPKVDAEVVRRSLIIRGVFFTIIFALIYFSFLN